MASTDLNVSSEQARALEYIRASGSVSEAQLALTLGIRNAQVEPLLADLIGATKLTRKRNAQGQIAYALDAAGHLPPMPMPNAPPAESAQPAYTVKLAAPASRNMPAGLGKWDPLFEALINTKPADNLVPTVDTIPIDKSKAIASAARSWAKKKGLKPCPISISTRGGKLLVQRLG
jgi:hypothetical protein